jgi:predicted DNA-binding transcriptional regulator YafY
MSRAARLLDLIQILRRHRQPVSGAALAGELQISLRTLYRDIATLMAQGAPIDGEAGVGYVLKAGFVLPPLMFSDEELEALVLGSRWVMQQNDSALALAAQNALAKIVSVLPGDLRNRVDGNGLLAAPRSPQQGIDLAPIRLAIRHERKLRIAYKDGAGKQTDRVIWPIAIGFFEQSRVLAAWCESRKDFRHFRTDRIVSLTALDAHYPQARRGLFKAWRKAARVPDNV